jgi:hypothetical protein
MRPVLPGLKEETRRTIPLFIRLEKYIFQKSLYLLEAHLILDTVFRSVIYKKMMLRGDNSIINIPMLWSSLKEK